MSSIEILDYKTIDLNKIIYNDPEKVKGGSYMSIPLYNNNPIYIQSPRLHSNKGIIKNDTRCYTELDFDKTHWPFYEFITNMDEYNITKIHTNSSKWFSKEFPLDIVEEFYKSPVKNGKANKPPSLKIKIPVIKGDISCNIYNSNNNTINYHDIKMDSKILCVLKLQGLRFLKQQVICEWVPLQIKVFQSEGASNYIINDNLLTDMEDNDEQMPNINSELTDTIEFNEEPNVIIKQNVINENTDLEKDGNVTNENTDLETNENTDLEKDGNVTNENTDLEKDGNVTNENTDLVTNENTDLETNENTDLETNENTDLETNENTDLEKDDNVINENTDLEKDDNVINENTDLETNENTDLVTNENTDLEKDDNVINENIDLETNENTDLEKDGNVINEVNDLETNEDNDLVSVNIDNTDIENVVIDYDVNEDDLLKEKIHEYELLIDEKNNIIENMKNKFNKLKEFIN